MRQRNWLIHSLTPTADPLIQLANSLTQDDPALSAADDLRVQLAADPQTLRRAAEKRVARAYATRLLLIVDQFEELFTQCHDEAARRAFIDNLLAAARVGGDVTVLIGLRADFTGQLTEVEALRTLVEQNFALLGPMQQADLVRVIAEPARLGGWAFVNSLVEQFLSDAGQEPGRLPLLSHALLETWARRAGHVMTLRGYREAGGVEGAIAKTAEDTLRRLDERDEQPIMQAIFLSLTELGEGSEDTRRIATRAELARAGNPAAVEAVLNTLAGARLVTVDADGVQVAHEALIRRWPRLREWLADNRERLRFGRQLEADAQAWKAYDFDTEALYGRARLAAAQEWHNGSHRLSPLVEEFLDRSALEAAEEAKKAKQLERAGLLRRFAWALGILAAVAIIVAVVAAGLAVVARNAQAEVEQLSSQIRSGRLAAEAEIALASNPEEALLLAVTAYQATNADGSATAGEVSAALYHALDTPYRMTLVGHQGALTSAAFSPDGTRMVTTSFDDTARLWDPTSGNALMMLEGHESVVELAAFSPDGRRVVTASIDGTARLWDAASGEELAVLQGHGDWVNTASFSPDGSRIVTASNDGTARLWDAVSGEELVVLQGHTDWVNAAAFSPDGSRLGTASSDGTARLWDATSGEEVAVLQGHEDRVQSVTFSQNGTQIVTAGDDGTARLWNATSGQELLVLRGHEGALNSAVFSPDGAQVAPASEDRTARLWNAANGSELTVLAGHTGGVLLAVFGPDGNRVITASRDWTARYWEVGSGRLLAELGGHTDGVSSAAFNPQGTLVLTTSWDGT